MSQVQVQATIFVVDGKPRGLKHRLHEVEVKQFLVAEAALYGLPDSNKGNVVVALGDPKSFWYSGKPPTPTDKTIFINSMVEAGVPRENIISFAANATADHVTGMLQARLAAMA